MTPLSVSRRQFLTAAALTGVTLSSRRLVWGQDQKKEPELDWYDVRDWGLEGRGWDDTEAYFDRFPARAKGVVPGPVWSLSRHSAGMLVHFETDADRIWTDHVVTSSRLAGDNMTAIGASGLDLYAKDPQGKWKWLSVSRPNSQNMKGALISGLSQEPHSFQLYLPLYNGTKSLRIGIPKGMSFTPVAPRKEKPIVFYGTSITHGASASRPGMPHPAILGRRLNKPVINLGFSGNGRMESSVGQFLCELDPVVYVIDCLPNMNANQVQERAAPLVRQLRAARPETPIVLVEDRTYSNTPFIVSRQERHATSRAALRKAYEELQKEGVQKLHYLEGEKLLGEDREDTTDGSHPSDLGFMRHADAFEPVLKAALAQAK